MSATSTQDMVRPGECVDLYYYDAETSKKQCFPTTQNTKYVQNFANLTGGSSVFTIPPANGIQDVVCSFQFATLSGANQANIALPRGWGYSLIKQVSYRYGGSSQYFLTGDQILQLALKAQPSRTSANDILTLGGNYLNGSAQLIAPLMVANIVLPLPHSSPSAFGKRHPLPTDALTQQVQITVELNTPSSVFILASGALPAEALTLLNASFQVQQVMLNNQGDALARRVDMATNAYAFPTEFCQQKQTIQLGTVVEASNVAQAQSVVLTGFRSGEVKSIQVWLTKGSDTSSATTLSPTKWYLPDAVEMSYAGDIYARYNGGTSQLFNLVNNNKASAVETVLINVGAGGISSPGAWLSQWVELPFAQTFVDEDAHHMLVHGKPITNGIVNLSVTVPAAYATNGDTDWVLNVSYIYNTTLLFSQGTCDYVF